MATFADLPPELFDEIVSYLPPCDMSTLSKTSRAFYEATIPHLYRNIRMVWTVGHAPAIHLLLRSLLINRKLGPLVDSIRLMGELRGSCNTRCLPSFPWPPGSMPGNVKRQAMKYVRQSGFPQVQRWIQALRDHNIHVNVALVVSLLPEVRELILGAYFNINTPFMGLLFKHLLPSWIAPSPSQPPCALSKVETVVFLPFAEPCNWDVQCHGINPFLVPCLLYHRHIKCLDAVFFCTKKIKWPLGHPPRCPSLRALKLPYTQTSEKALCQLLSTAPNLQELRYDRVITLDPEKDADSSGQTYDLETVNNALKLVQNTLKVLHLSIAFDGVFITRPFGSGASRANNPEWKGLRNALCSLQKFPQLQAVGLPMVYLFGEKHIPLYDSASTNLEILPPSLVSLYLRDDLAVWDTNEWRSDQCLERVSAFVDNIDCLGPSIQNIGLTIGESQFASDWGKEKQDAFERICGRLLYWNHDFAFP